MASARAYGREPEDDDRIEAVERALARIEKSMEDHVVDDRDAFAGVRAMIGGFETGGPSISKQLREIHDDQIGAAAQRKTTAWLLGVVIVCLVTLALDKIGSWLKAEHASSSATPKEPGR